MSMNIPARKKQDDTNFNLPPPDFRKSVPFNAIPIPSMSESKVKPLFIQAIMHHVLETSYTTLKKINAAKVPPSDSAHLAAAYQILLKTEALFNKVSEEGEFFETDLDELTTLRRMIEEQKGLTEKTEKAADEQDPAYLLEIAAAALNELDALNESMDDSFALEQSFLAILETIESGTFSQQFSGESLLMAARFAEGCEVLRQLSDLKYGYTEGSLARRSTEEMISYGVKSLAFALSEWTDHADAVIKQQKDALLDAYQSGNEEQRVETAALLGSLKNQLEANVAALIRAQSFCRNFSDLNAMADTIERSLESLKNKQKALETAISKAAIAKAENIPAYGSDEWRELAASRFPLLPADRDEAGWALFHPERWGDATKQFVRMAFYGLQLNQQLIAESDRINLRGGSIANAEESGSAVAGWFEGAINRITGVFGQIFAPAETANLPAGNLTSVSTQEEKAEFYRAQRNSAEYKTAGDRIASTKMEVEKGIAKAKDERNVEHLTSLHKAQRDLELVLRERPALGASHETAAGWREKVELRCDRAAELLSKIKGPSGQVQKTPKPLTKVEEHTMKVLQAYIESPSQLPPRGNVESNEQLPDKLFQHLLGDFFGKDTRLEGYSSQEMLKYVLGMVSAKVDSLRNHPLCDDGDRDDYCSSLMDVAREDLPLDTFLRLEQQMKQAADFQEVFEESKGAAFVEAFRKKIDSLSPGESFFFLGGWQKKTAGHAIVYEIAKEANGLFTFRIFNRGEGADKHISAVIEGRQQMMSFMEIVEIPREGITNPLFSLGILEIDQRPRENQDDWGPGDLYDKLLPLLEGKNSGRLYTKDMMMRQLHVGHCSYLSLTALMNYHLGDRHASAKWEVEMQFKTLWDYYSQVLSVLPTEEQPRRLLREGFVQFSRNLADARGSHAISDAEVAWIGDKLKTLEIDLIDAEAEAQTLAIETSPVVSLQPIHAPLNNASRYVDFVGPQPNDEAFVPLMVQFVDRSEWEYQPERLVADLQSLLAETRELGPLQITSAKVAIETFLSRIPIQGRVFWQGITPEEATRSLGLLSDLSRTYFKISSLNKFKLNEVNKLFPEEYLAAIKILTLSDALAADFKDKWGFGFPNLYQVTMDLVLESGSIASSIADPVWEEERRQLRDYWRQVSQSTTRNATPFKRYSTPSLTGVEYGYDEENNGGQYRHFHRYSDTPPKEKFNDEKVLWGDVAFALNWLKQPGVVKKLPNSGFTNKGDLHQALLLLTKDYRHVDYGLPAEFFYLRDISRAVFYSHCKIKNPFFENLADPQSKMYPERGWTKIGDRSNLLFEDEYILDEGDSLQLVNPNNQWIERVYQTTEERLVHEPFELMEKTQGAGLHSPLLEWLVPFAETSQGLGLASTPHVLVRNRISPHGRLVIFHKRPADGNDKFTTFNSIGIKVDLPFFETQEFLSLSSVQALQIQETLAFFKLNAHLLLQRHYQEMFHYLMTENGLFIDELLKDPELTVEFTTSLASFCSGQYYASKERGEIGDMLYFLDLNRQFADLLNFTMKKYPGAFPEGFSSPFSNYNEEIRELAMRPSLPSVDRGSAHLILMESAIAEERFSDRSLKDLLLGCLHFDIYGLPVNQDTIGVAKERVIGGPDLGTVLKPKSDRWDPYKTRRMEEILVKVRRRLESALSDPVVRDRLFNEALAVYIPGFKPQGWRTAPAFPYFQSSDGRYSLDLEQGAVFDRGVALRVFPHKERELRFVKSVLGEAPNVLVRRSIDGTLEFQDRFGNEYLLQRGAYLYKKIDGRWYRAFDPGAFSRMVKEDLIAGSIVWVGPGKGSAPISGGIFQTIGSIFKRRDLPFEQLEAFVADRVSNRLKYRLILDCIDAADKEYVVSVVHRLDGEQKETGEVLAEIQHSGYGFFNRIETLDHVLVWQNQETKKPVRIELPQYDLNFTVRRQEGEWVASLDSQPELHIARCQHVPQLGDITSYLVLEDGEGEKFALIPEVPFNELDIPFVTETTLVDQKGKKYFLQRVAGDGSELVPESREDRFKLARLFFWERDYARTMKYLRGYGPLTRPLEEKEKQVLESLIDLWKSNKDQSLEACAIRLSASLLIGSFVKKFFDDLQSYYDGLDQLGNLRLRPDEEKALERIRGTEAGTKASYFTSGRKLGWIGTSTWELSFNGEDVIRSVLESMGDASSRNGELPEIPSPSAVNPPIAYYFGELYSALKQANYDANLIDLIEKLTGIPYPRDLDAEKVKKIALQVLSMYHLYSGSYKVRKHTCSAELLLAVMNTPDKFPPLELIQQKYKGDISLFLEQEKVLEKALEWRSRYYKIPSADDEYGVLPSSYHPVVQNEPISPLTPAHQMSVRLAQGIPIQFSGAANLDRVVEWIPPEKESLSAIRKAGAELGRFFAVDVKDPTEKAKFEKLQGDVAAAAVHREAAAGHYRLKSPEALNELKGELLVKSRQLEILLETQERAMLTLANKPFESVALEAERTGRLAGRLEMRLTAKELFHLFYRRDKEAVARRNPALTAEEIGTLFELIRVHLETVTLRQHQERMLKRIADIGKKPGPVELKALVDDFASAAKANRQYLVDHHPEYLNLEKEKDILVRKDQVDNLEKLAHTVPREKTTGRKGAAIEALLGSGKTSVLLLQQALSAADGEHLSLMVMPESLMPSMSVEIQELLGEAYGMFYQIAAFDRNSPSDKDALQKYDDLFDDAIQNRKAVGISDKSIQSFLLKYVEMIVSSEGEVTFEIHILERIISRFVKLGVATLDEIDQILDTLRSHHFTLGSSTPLKLEVAEVVSGLYGFISIDVRIQEMIKFPFLTGGRGPVFTEATYHDTVQPYIVGKFMDGTICGSDKELKRFLKALSREQKSYLEDYLNARKSPEALAFFQGIESVRIKNMLAVFKEEVTVLLPLTASKKVKEHYGPKSASPEEGRKRSSDVSIPYRGSNRPVVGSEHGTELEIVNYSVQMCLALGVTESTVGKELQSMLDQAKEEFATQGVARLEDSNSVAAFRRLCGGETKFNLFNLSEEDVREITLIINNDPDLKMEMITKYVIPQVKSFPIELSSSGELYAFMLHVVKGFTGTLWNAESFPDIFYAAIESDTMAKTLNILWEMGNREIPVLALPENRMKQSENAAQLVNAIYSRKEGYKGCFADASGVFREIEDNSLVAKEILRHQPEGIKGVVYYDQSDRVMVWMRGQDEGIPFERCRLAKEELAVFWDQQHTTGSDVKLGLTMTATVSIGRHTLMRDLIQAVWRMRGLEKGQKVDFIVADEDLQVIRETLKEVFGREVGGTLDLGDFFLYALHLQMSRQGDDNFRSLKSKLNGVLIRKVMEVLVDPKISSYEKTRMIYGVRSLFVDEANKEPYEVYGGITEELPKEQAVQNEVDRILKGEAFNAFKASEVLSSRYSADEIEKELRAVASKCLPVLSSQIGQNTGYDKEVAVEVEAELSTEQETEKETEKNVRKMVEGEMSSVPRSVMPWRREALFSSKAYVPEALDKVTSASFEMLELNDLPGVVSINPVLAADPSTKEYGDIFEDHLLSTLNFMPIYLKEVPDQLTYHPFGRYHDVVSNVIVVENRKTGVIKLVIGNQEDSKAIDQLLEEDSRDPVKKGREERVCLYNLQNGIIRQGSERFDAEKLESNPQMIRLKTQAKFFAGLLNYSPEEQKVLREWIKEKGPMKMLKFFREVVLAEKETRQAQYQKSHIQRIFDELIEEEEAA